MNNVRYSNKHGQGRQTLGLQYSDTSPHCKSVLLSELSGYDVLQI